MTESEKKKKKAAADPQTTSSVQIQVPRSFTSIACIFLVIPYLLAAGYFFHTGKSTAQAGPDALSQTAKVDDTRLSPSQAKLLKPGPWGEVEYVPIFIECPDEYLSPQTDSTADRRWFFQNYTPETLHQFFKSIGEITPEQQQQLTNGKLEAVANGLYLTPAAETVFSLSPVARKKIYRVLTQFSENNWQREAYVLPAESFDSHFEQSGVDPKTVALVKKLCYSYGRLLLFADLPYVLDTLPTFEQKMRLEKAVSRRSTLLLRLQVNPRSDVNALISYWGRGGTSKDLRPLIQSIGRVPQGEHLNVALMLPPMPASRLYTYPFPSYSQPENCHWSSFNFFRDPPDNRYSDLKFLREKLDSDYYPMFTDPRYGDLVFLTRPNGDIVHSAVFIADDVVFTKNGGHFSAPWILMRLPELVDAYSTFVGENEALKVAYYRNKYY